MTAIGDSQPRYSYQGVEVIVTTVDGSPTGKVMATVNKLGMEGWRLMRFPIKEDYDTDDKGNTTVTLAFEKVL